VAAPLDCLTLDWAIEVRSFVAGRRRPPRSDSAKLEERSKTRLDLAGRRDLQHEICGSFSRMGSGGNAWCRTTVLVSERRVPPGGRVHRAGAAVRAAARADAIGRHGGAPSSHGAGDARSSTDQACSATVPISHRAATSDTQEAPGGPRGLRAFRGWRSAPVRRPTSQADRAARDRCDMAASSRCPRARRCGSATRTGRARRTSTSGG